MSVALDSPQAVQRRLIEIEQDLATRQGTLESAAKNWCEAKREREHDRAVAFINAVGTVAERQAIADRSTALQGVEAEAEWESVRAVVRVLETRASVLQSVLRAQSHV